MPNPNRFRAIAPVLLLFLGIAVWQFSREPAFREPQRTVRPSSEHTPPSEMGPAGGSSVVSAPRVLDTAPPVTGQSQEVGLPESLTANETDLEELFAGEDFLHVPDWLPRLQAVSITVEDATLRSDGLREGTVHYTFQEGQEISSSESARSAMLAAGFREGLDVGEFLREDPPAVCRLSFVKQSDNHIRMSVGYRDGGHHNGCACPGCGGPAPESP